MREILLIDADLDFSLSLSEQLSLEGFQVQRCDNAAGALEMIENDGLDMALLELNVPGGDGFELCRAVRRVSDLPLIVLSERAEVLDKVVALELGADDYLAKPFEIQELIARMKAVLRRCDARDRLPHRENQNTSAQVTLPGLEIDRGLYRVAIDGQVVDMPPKELELLALLAANPNRVFTREQILDAIWGYEFFGESRTVDVHIKRLREKIAATGAKLSWHLKTVWSIGYKLELLQTDGAA